MSSSARVAAYTVHAIATVHRYRLEVIAEARRRGLRLVSEAPSDLTQPLAGDCLVIDTADIRLIILDGPGGGGARLRWNPDTGWWLARPGTDAHRNSYARADASPLDLLPPAQALLDWVAEELHARPVGTVHHLPRLRSIARGTP